VTLALQPRSVSRRYATTGRGARTSSRDAHGSKGTIALLVLFADARLTREPLAWLALAQYGLVIALGAAAFSLVPRPVRRTTPGYTGAWAVAGAVAVLTLAWLIQIDLSALAAPSVAAFGWATRALR
jgi:hypothetical protein